MKRSSPGRQACPRLNATLSKNDKRQSCRRADRATIDIVEEEATDVRVHYSGVDLRPWQGAVSVQNGDTAQQGVVADLSRLHFRPLSSMLIRVETCQSGRASAPGS